MSKALQARPWIVATAITGAVVLLIVFGVGVSGRIADGPVVNQETWHSNLATKIALQQREEATVEAARATFKGPKTTPVAWLTPIPVEPVPTGILEDFSPYPGWGTHYRIENVWQHVAGGQRITVYAGSVADDPVRGRWNDPEQGLVKVMIFPPGPTNAIIHDYLTPTRVGRLRIVAADILQLTLASTTSDARLKFDVGTRQWLPGSGADKQIP